MEYSTALENFFFLKNLTLDKLLVSSHHLLQYDNRWFQGIRRTATGDSRFDLIEPIKDTFSALQEHIDSTEQLEVLKHIQKTFIETYPDFNDLHATIAYLIANSYEKEPFPADEDAIESYPQDSYDDFDHAEIEEEIKGDKYQDSTAMSTTLVGEDDGSVCSCCVPFFRKVKMFARV